MIKKTEHQLLGEGLYDATALACSKLITKAYSTSFTLGIRSLAKKFHDPIYAIYGFVRLADEIVDTFHQQDKKKLLAQFRSQTLQAIQEKYSTNPVLHAFQKVVHRYHIELSLIEAFLCSMEMDLEPVVYDQNLYKKYIYGSAEVVGLMCLWVFVEGNSTSYQQLEAAAARLGAAFQKVNFLRDIRSDFIERGRIYFPGVNYHHFDDKTKQQIEAEIESDFEAAYQGIKKLPSGARLGVYLAYKYYKRLLSKIKAVPANVILDKRIRVPDSTKLWLLIHSYFRYQLNIF
jgi:phytoene/squalene synthetase